MAEFEKKILGFIPEEEWLDVGFNVTRQNDPIDGLIGDTRTNNLVAYYQTIASEYQIPMMAQFHGFDTEAQTTFRVPIDTHNIEKGLIKVKLNQSERMRALLRAGVRNEEMYDYVINDGVRLADQVVTRTKVAKNELLAYGKVTIKENNLDLTVDYGVPGDQTTGLDIDFTDNGDVIASIQDIIDKANAKGVILNTIVTSKAMISKMCKHKSVQLAINGSAETGAIVRRSAFDEFMNEEFGITRIITNDLTYGADSKITEGRPVITTKRYYPVDMITFLGTNPAGRVGEGLWGDPPEVDARNYAQQGASTVSPFVYVSQWQENDPAVLWTKASALFIPVLYNPSAIWIAKAKPGGRITPELASVPEQAKAYSELGNKKVSDMISPDTFIDRHGDVYGTLKYISDFEAFNQSDESEQSGNYFPVDLGKKYEGKQITCTGEKTKTEEDTEWVLRVARNDSTFKFSTDGEEILTLKFKDADLQQNPSPVAKVMAKKPTRAVAKKNTTDETVNTETIDS